jgi:anhydro-N-acetylmuramic acid kinase
LNQHLQRLYLAAQKPRRRIIGLMSGTSMDGLDIAVCQIAGAGEATQVQIEHFRTVEYTEAIKDNIRSVFAKQTIDFTQLVLLNGWLGQLHGQMILDSLAFWRVDPSTIDAIASHGQTVMHAPKSLHGQKQFDNATLQIGDGDHIAVKTGITTVSDFRQKHIAAGGEGAPLAVYGDYYLFATPAENRIMLNIGGIANFTFLPSSRDAQRVFVTDTGPGNTLLDACIRAYLPGHDYDRDALVAMQGQVHPGLLAALKEHSFFSQPFPKTTGPELFNLSYLQAAQSASDSSQLALPDIMATLTRFSAETIATAVLRCAAEANLALANCHLYLSGGGSHNPLLVQWLKALLPGPFAATNSLGINADAKEAVLFAILANETLSGGQSDFGKRRGIPSVAMGKISFPG